MLAAPKGKICIVEAIENDSRCGHSHLSSNLRDEGVSQSHISTGLPELDF
jgi:hypothetical protein